MNKIVGLDRTITREGVGLNRLPSNRPSNRPPSKKKFVKKHLSLLPLKQEHKSLGKHLLDRMYASEH